MKRTERSGADDGSKRARPRGGSPNEEGYDPGPSASGEGAAGGLQEGEGGGRGEGRGFSPGEGRGRGRGGRGIGRGEGRGARRGRRGENFDMVVYQPAPGQILKKQAVLGNARQVKLASNYFKVEHRPDWAIYHYRVDFKPDDFDTRAKKLLMRPHGQSLGAYIFDGSSLYVSHRLAPDPMLLYSLAENSTDKIEMTVRLVAELAPTDVMNLQIFNIIVRKCLEAMQLEEMGRNFFDRHQAQRLDAHRLELWPGYKTTLRNHEHDILLGVEVIHKVLRLDSCLHVMMKHRGKPDGQQRISDELIGSIVMTSYNRKTYRVDDIDWNTTASSTFDLRGTQTSFLNYFRDKYNIHIRDPGQPLLVSRPKKKDIHRGMTGPILLIPELCQMTGITDEMRANNNLMKAIAQYLHTDPPVRVNKIKDFMQRMKGNHSIDEELSRWGLKFNDRMVEFTGHVIPPENILFGGGKVVAPDHNYDWTKSFRDTPLLKVIDLRSWAVIVPARDAHCVEKLVNTMQRVARPLQFNISSPMEISRIHDAYPKDYAKAVDTIMNQYKDRVQMIFVILPRNVQDIYSAVKRRACVEYGVPSQCFVAKNAYNERGIMSICTKVVVQMSTKLGGEPWAVQIPLKNLMVVGFDVYHAGKRKGASVGAMVASTSPTHGRYYSTVSYHSTREELSEKMATDFTKCLHAFRQANEVLPDRIIMYRDGVGDGQLNFVYETELEEIQKQLKKVYDGAGKSIPRFTFIVVTKRINTRLFSGDSRPGNPFPGTVADDVITLPERYDFFLVSQIAKQGTVSPVSYNVLFDRQGLDADKIQRLTFKLCHMYYNWSGTVTVPAPCQYAHKLAYLTGLSLGSASNEKMSNTLFFL